VTSIDGESSVQRRSRFGAHAPRLNKDCSYPPKPSFSKANLFMARPTARMLHPLLEEARAIQEYLVFLIRCGERMSLVIMAFRMATSTPSSFQWRSAVVLAFRATESS
jgi:hypothetical protein